MVTFYIIYALQYEWPNNYLFNKSSSSAKDERLMVTSLTITVNFAIDVLNLSVIIYISQHNHKLINILLKNFAAVDENALIVIEQITWKIKR